MNKTTKYIISGLFLLGCITYFILTSESMIDDHVISTQKEDNERVKNLNLEMKSKDLPYILDTNKLSFPSIKKEPQSRDYKADPEREWIIDIIQVNGGSFRKKDFEKMFDYEWRSKYQSTIYGFSPAENRWTYADAGGTPDLYSKLQVAVNIQETYNEENPDYNPLKLERYLIELEERKKISYQT